jgi:hypothetical protein
MEISITDAEVIVSRINEWGRLAAAPDLYDETRRMANTACATMGN